MPIFTTKRQSCELLADKAFRDADATLQQLNNARDQADDTVDLLTAEIEKLMARKQIVVARRDKLSDTADKIAAALYHIEESHDYVL
ncbi:hypothetical protein [Vreelandella sulfidaeris]|uniref:Uncharacterized protein n=1 Tax=Vreelandella sulfidaeris TaxID=115553 RepID=A0A455U6B2_9GAMM|nr:hypothetical protein HSBAA_30060 [Halomonas sulfidaeris]